MTGLSILADGAAHGEMFASVSAVAALGPWWTIAAAVIIISEAATVIGCAVLAIRWTRRKWSAHNERRDARKRADRPP